MGKLFWAGALAGLLLASYAFTYKHGEQAGAAKVSADWAGENTRRDEAYAKLKKENADLQTAHTQRQKELSDELAASTATFQATLDGYRIDYDGRLQLATTRAGVYQRQARGSATEQERLAKHAAELDRSLEEGRALVRELGATVEQRDRTIRALGQLILNDRTLLSGETHGY
ncbi:hypothetical protein D3C85_734950 [compost metagenome]